jgi:hypothetical protein
MSSKKYGSQFLKGLTRFRVPEELTSQAIEEYLTALDCPRALTILTLFRNKEFEQLVGVEFDPRLYLTMESCRDAYAATKFLSKYKAFAMNLDLDEVALKKFREFELLCKQTNGRFRNLALDPKFRGRAVWLHNAVIRKIAKILGDFSAEEFFSMPDWGPGASTLIKRRDASSVKKFQCETGITRDLYSLIPLSLMEEVYPLWARQLNLVGYPNFQVGNKVITVAKDASTNRVIAVEPGINLWFQKSIGEMVGKRLLRYGVDLRFQNRNQQLARVASITGDLATVDLSSASDSIAGSVVESLLPSRWFHLMDASRSHFGALGNSLVKWEKFSSMGNGFTFQLESLIFYAVAVCCAEYLHVSSTDVSTYGDDVILPCACFELFSEMLDFYGFRLNVKKSHFDSPFRESCGAHYFSGWDVKPIYLKDRVKSIPAVYRLANAVRRQAHRRVEMLGCDRIFKRLFERLVHVVPEALRLRIPTTLGDGGFISNFDEATPSRARHGLEGFRVRNLVEVSKTYYDETNGYLLAALWRLPEYDHVDYRDRAMVASFLRKASEMELWDPDVRLKAIAMMGHFSTVEGYNSVPLNGRLRSKVANSLVQQWYDLGPWF